MPAPKLLLLDCDSTLSSIEGIDELGRVRGEAVFREVEAMTNAAMDGKIPVQSVFGRRLEIIRPTADHVAQVGAHYLATVEPTAKATLDAVRALGWTPMIVSGGFRQAIRPLADYLGIARVEAVDFRFNADGSYAGYDGDYPTTRSGGKPELVRLLKAELKPSRVVMVGDGVSDLETQPEVDLFVGYGGTVARPKVKAEARVFITKLSELVEKLRG
jgi:phosphoserine phosphatase